jgi:hypothetical protein
MAQVASVDVPGWDFAFELNEIAKQQAAAANIQLRFLRIPRDNKKWSLLPTLILVVLFSVLIILSGDGLAPFIYTLF